MAGLVAALAVLGMMILLTRIYIKNYEVSVLFVISLMAPLVSLWWAGYDDSGFCLVSGLFSLGFISWWLIYRYRITVFPIILMIETLFLAYLIGAHMGG